MPIVPEWLEAELRLAHPLIEIRWMPYAPRKTFVLPMEGDAFWRMENVRLGIVLHRRHITYATAVKWQVHPRTYIATGECAPGGRFVVFQKKLGSEELVKNFDVVNDDGSLRPIDRRVLRAIQVRDGKFGAHEKALADVEEAPAVAEVAASDAFEEAADDTFRCVHHAVKKATTETANVVADPADDEIVIHNQPLVPESTVH